MSAGPKDEKSIFITAQAMKTPAERDAYLDDACGADSALRARLAALLGGPQGRSDFLSQFIPAADFDEAHWNAFTYGHTPGNARHIPRMQVVAERRDFGA